MTKIFKAMPFGSARGEPQKRVKSAPIFRGSRRATLRFAFLVYRPRIDSFLGAYFFD